MEKRRLGFSLCPRGIRAGNAWNPAIFIAILSDQLCLNQNISRITLNCRSTRCRGPAPEHPTTSPHFFFRGITQKGMYIGVMTVPVTLLLMYIHCSSCGSPRRAPNISQFLNSKIETATRESMILGVPERLSMNRHLKQRETPTAGGVFLSTDDINLYRVCYYHQRHRYRIHRKYRYC